MTWAAGTGNAGRWCASLRRQSLPMGNYEAAVQIA
jgi:hypothetical protein